MKLCYKERKFECFTGENKISIMRNLKKMLYSMKRGYQSNGEKVTSEDQSRRIDGAEK